MRRENVVKCARKETADMIDTFDTNTDQGHRNVLCWFFNQQEKCSYLVSVINLHKETRRGREEQMKECWEGNKETRIEDSLLVSFCIIII